jgi:hypothetical protein
MRGWEASLARSTSCWLISNTMSTIKGASTEESENRATHTLRHYHPPVSSSDGTNRPLHYTATVTTLSITHSLTRRVVLS